jgi:hypothetical protein
VSGQVSQPSRLMPEPLFQRTRSKLESLLQATHLIQPTSLIQLTSIYSGEPLTERSIRLLFLQPSSFRHRQIECFCRPFNVDATPLYEALSYVWGAQNPSTNKTIICNGHKVSVGRNLGHALLKLRRTDIERVIWIDALCVRNAHVRNACETYTDFVHPTLDQSKGRR